MARKKLTDAQKQFIAGEDAEVLTSSSTSNDITANLGNNLKQELFCDREVKESSVRFTVDIPASLHKRLNQLGVDTGKPKTELVRTILDRALTSLDY